mmetsp:Transcript_29863/g.75152  ORF Transcript_29863/g.75152 Transcript_29863/m.75152 type:complete len:292 (-) Transcript_29863:1701-2576(-)|eukprot:CAMPEP_0115582072 /NCGR_PEP_ID=MMETSP0272-20121206/5472_1 /TAXON_ID=71861 /ORGANISM="Scrippsiella trochoidea, Strain CCMP3099" /LENGTH=291 /DNA_ID=CAMNT_0003017049 /DNA_START=79 /DNA_END=954 /DNA_ORIENTATION=+
MKVGASGAALPRGGLARVVRLRVQVQALAALAVAFADANAAATAEKRPRSACAFASTLRTPENPADQGGPLLAVEPFAQQPLSAENRPLQLHVERTRVMNSLQDLVFVLRPRGLAIPHIYLREAVIVVVQHILRMQDDVLRNARQVGFDDLCNAPSPVEQVELGINDNQVRELFTLHVEEAHHGVKFVDFTPRGIRVRDLRLAARAKGVYLMRHRVSPLCIPLVVGLRPFCGWAVELSAYASMLIDGECTHPICNFEAPSYREPLPYPPDPLRTGKQHSGHTVVIVLIKSV